MRVPARPDGPPGWAGQVFIDDHLHRAQHALFFAFGVDDALLGLGAFLATWKIGFMKVPLW
jgi:hypothetical protein